MLRALLITQLASAWTMVGIIWFVQVVHYPLFEKVGTDAFRDYHAAHTRLTTWVVGGPMLAELGSSALLLWLRPNVFPIALLVANLGIVVLLWISTAVVQVPLHDRLTPGFERTAHLRLVRTNWLRTLLWTLHGFIAVWMIWK